MGDNINSLINAGPDAFTNLYDVTFTPPAELTTYLTPAFIDNLKVRTQEFPFPTLTTQPYPVSYKGVTIKRIPPKITGTRKISLQFRIDNNWQIYTFFKDWKKLYFNESSNEINFSNTREAKYFGSILVNAYKSNTNLSSTLETTSTQKGPEWKFEQVACINVIEPAFTRDSANPLMLTAEFLFATYTPPGEKAQ